MHINLSHLIINILIKQMWLTWHSGQTEIGRGPNGSSNTTTLAACFVVHNLSLHLIRTCQNNILFIKLEDEYNMYCTLNCLFLKISYDENIYCNSNFLYILKSLTLYILSPSWGRILQMQLKPLLTYVCFVLI